MIVSVHLKYVYFSSTIQYKPLLNMPRSKFNFGSSPKWPPNPEIVYINVIAFQLPVRNTS